MVLDANLFRHVFSHLPIPVLLLDTDSFVEQINPAAAALLQNHPSWWANLERNPPTGEEASVGGAGMFASGRHPLKTVFPWIAQEWEAFWKSESSDIDIDKDIEEESALFSFRVSLRRLRDGAGKRTGTLVVVCEQTELRSLQTVLEERERKLQFLSQRTSLGYQSLDEEGSFLEVSQSWLDFFGFSREEVIHRWFGDFLTPEARNEFMRRFPLLRSQGEILGEEFEMVRKDGSRVIVAFYGHMGCDKRGRPQQAHLLLQDISERKQQNRLLRESEERFRSAFEYAAIGMALVCVEGRFVEVNLALCRMLGYSVRELLDRTLQSVTHPEDLERSMKAVRRLLNGEVYSVQLEKRYIHKQGHDVWGLVSIVLVRDDREKPLYLITQVQDITDRKRVERERALLAAASQQAAESIVIINPDGRVVFANPAFTKLTGIPCEEIIGRNFLRFKERSPQQTVLYGEIGDRLASGEAWNGCLSEECEDGSQKELDTTISPIREESGRVINFVVIQRDVTYEKEMERQIRQSQKTEAMGTLAGGIAHDFNNILGAIIGYTEMALHRLPADSPLRRNMEQVLKAGDRAKELVQQILTFSRQGEQELKPLRISILIKEALKLLRSSLPATIEIRQKITCDGCFIKAVPSQIHQVLMNLCINSAHAMQTGGGVLEVVLGKVDLDEAACSHWPELKPGSFIKLGVSDTGHGMSSSILARVFDPFFTTKAPGKGTGMGLAVVHGIVKNHHGAIHVESEEGKGTVVQILFPECCLERTRDVTTREDEIPRGQGRVLFVDDEAFLVDSGRQMLEFLGYDVRAITSSEEALSLFQAEPLGFDIVITDQTMPRMTGMELARFIKAIRPDIPILLCSGFSESLGLDEARKLGVREFIMKPVLIRELASAIRRVLDKT